jgi:hypothetical protein
MEKEEKAFEMEHGIQHGLQTFEEKRRKTGPYFDRHSPSNP